MSDRRLLLLEIGTEELPSSAVEQGMSELRAKALAAFQENRLGAREREVKVYGTPRRLVLSAKLDAQQVPRKSQVTGPPAKAAFDDAGKPTAAALGFAKSQGLAPEDLKRVKTDKGEYVAVERVEKGQAAVALLPEVLPALISSITFQKSMRWGDGSMRFSRPVRWVAALYGSGPVEFSVDGLKSGTHSMGHRLLKPGAMRLKDASSYKKAMTAARVMVDQDERRRVIQKQIADAAATVRGRAVVDQKTLDEVVNLVEWPHAVCGTYSRDFLALPREVLIMAMQSHQRYFAVENREGRLLPAFVVVHNGDPKQADLIRRGHERVLRSRLADAAFFFREDQKAPLESRVDALEGIVWQAKRGTMLDKTRRVELLAAGIARLLATSDVVRKTAVRAARLAKADLTTQTVVEFPDLQGVMGREYALISGESGTVATAIFEHYLPRQAGEEPAASAAGRVVAIADKMDSLAGCFLVGLAPTGSQDPYQLRRQAQGIIATLLRYQLHLSLSQLIDMALASYQRQKAKGRKAAEVRAELIDFFAARFRNYLLNRGFAYDELDAVLEAGLDDCSEAYRRLEAVKSKRAGVHMDDLIVAFTRCKNLADPSAGMTVRKNLLKDKTEKALYEAITAAEDEVRALVNTHQYGKAIDQLVRLRRPVDKFFDDVLVMAEQKGLRQNRLALLNRTVGVFNQVADFTKLVVAGEDKA